MPLFKKGSRADPGNYRPVSLTSILEGNIKDYIDKYIHVNKIINSNQHGLIRNRSCKTNLIIFYKEVSKYKGESVDVTYLDFAKVFYTVPHERLMYKIKIMGMAGNVSSWIYNWIRQGATSSSKRIILRFNKGSKWNPPGISTGPCSF